MDERTPSMSVTLTDVPPSTRILAAAHARCVLPVPTGPQTYAPRPRPTPSAIAPALGSSAAANLGAIPALAYAAALRPALSRSAASAVALATLARSSLAPAQLHSS